MMARKKAGKALRLRVLRSFDLFKIGETVDHFGATARIDGLVAAGFLEVVGDGASEAGPVATDASDPGGSPESAPAESAPGAEPGAHFGSGGYGASES